MEVDIQVQYINVHRCFLPMQGFDHSWLLDPNQFEKYCDLVASQLSKTRN